MLVDFIAAGAVPEMSDATMGMQLCRSRWNSLLVLYTGEDVVHHQMGNCNKALHEDNMCLAAWREGKQEDEGRPDTQGLAKSRAGPIRNKSGIHRWAVLIHNVAIRILLPNCIPPRITLPLPLQFPHLFPSRKPV